MSDRPLLGEGITGWAIDHGEAQLVNDAHLDPRVKTVPGTPADEPEALISVPLVARGAIKGALNVYRLGRDAKFSDEEFELAKRFGDAAALALDNAQVRAVLELQAQTDSLTGLYNHRYFHDRLRAELNRASRAHDSIAVLMLDIDDFKRVNDVSRPRRGRPRPARAGEPPPGDGADVRRRLPGRRRGVRDHHGLLRRRRRHGPRGSHHGRPWRRPRSSRRDGSSSRSGSRRAPQHAMNPRELVACAEVAMMTAKARGKGEAVLFGDDVGERPSAAASVDRDVRSIAHLKMLQSLGARLNRLNDVREIGEAIVDELRLLVDYHSCRVYVVDGNDLLPIAWRGDVDPYMDESVEALRCQGRRGDHRAGRGRAAWAPAPRATTRERCELRGA